jgi:hypothetical protein
MRPGNSVPRLAVVVANGITGDSRVQKAAIAAARDGWEVTLVGRSLTGKVQRTTLGPIDVVRVPTTDDFKAHAKLREGHHVRRSVTQFGIPSSAALKQHRAAHQAWLLRQRTAVEYATGLARLGAPVRRTAIAARDAVHRFRNRAWGWEQFRRPKTAPPTGDWRLDWPALVDDSLAFVPVLVDLKPDVIHSNDITTVGLVGQAVAQLRSTGHRVGWLYDAHEYVQGVDWLVAARASAFTALEREFIGRADAV